MAPRKHRHPDETLDWLRLIRSENVGPVTFFHLLRRYGSAADALAALPEIARRAGRHAPLRILSRAEAEREIAGLKQIGARLVAHGTPDYPAQLAHIEDAPPLLAMMGRGDLAAKPAVGVVGARNASALGMRFTRDIAREIAAHGLVVASGLARGIDAAAHDGALSAGGTMAFIGTGIDVAFPPENAKLQQRIAEAGALFAEMPLGSAAKPQNFPRRNRLISGASLAILVVEAAQKSGSLITARMAAEQGREVMAVPGSPLDPRCHGTNDLIRQGAVLVERIDDILAVVQPLARRGMDEPPTDYGAVPGFTDREIADAQTTILALLSPSPVPVDELIRQSGLGAALVQTVLLEAELADLIERHPGNRVARK